jgi:hypothetical protein
MKIYRTSLFALLLLSAIFGISCKKNSKADGSFPTITFYSPGQGQVYHVFDSIYVSADINDGSSVKEVKVSLLDANSNTVQEPLLLHPNTSSYTLATKYVISNHFLETGTYYLKINASDGSNTAQRSVAITIIESPIQKKGYYVFTVTGLNTTFRRLDTSFAVNFTKTIPSAFTGSAFSAYYQRLFIAGGANQNFQCYETENHSVKWSIPYNLPGMPSFTYCETDGKNVCLGFTDGRLKRYSTDGLTLTNFIYSNNDYYPVLGVVRENEYIASYQSRSSSQKKLIVFNSTSGAGVQEAPVNYSANGIFEKSASEVYVVGNTDANQGTVAIFNTQTGGIFVPFTIPNGKILSSCQIDNNSLLIGHSDGNIYKYEYSTNNFVPIQPGILASRMKYSSHENVLYVTQGNDLKLFSLNAFSLNPGPIYNSTDSIRDFQVIYDK